MAFAVSGIHPAAAAASDANTWTAPTGTTHALANSVIASVNVGRDPDGLAYDNLKGEIFVANTGSSNLSVINDLTNTVVSTIALDSTPSGVTFDPREGEVYVTTTGVNCPSYLKVISDQTDLVKANISVPCSAGSLAYDSGAGEVFVADYASNDVSVVDCANNSVVATVELAGHPDYLAYDSRKGEVFVAEDSGYPNYTGNISVINDTVNRVVTNISLGPEPGGVSYDSKKGEIFVTELNWGEVGVINDSTNSIVASISLNMSLPEGITYDSGAGELYVANTGPGGLGVISDTTDTQVARISTGGEPAMVAYDSEMGEVFAANLLQNNVSVVSDGTFPLTFSEIGLPAGSPWSLGLNGLTQSSNESSIRYSMANGTYSFSVRTPPDYSAAPHNGTVTVNGSADEVEIIFASVPPVQPRYPIEFREVGLLTGANWSVTLNGTRESSTESSISFEESNGTYPFVVGSIAGYTITTPAGNITVNGTNVTLAVTFISIPPETYSVAFAESGLAPGTTWAVDFNNQTEQGNGTQIEFGRIPNGTYLFTIPPVKDYSVMPSIGRIGISGGGHVENVVFTAIPPYVVASASWNQVSATGLCGPPGAYSLTVRFFGNATGGTPPYSYSWNFGDGSPASALQNPEHTFTGYPYVGTLTVTDHQGNESNASVTIPEIFAPCATAAPPPVTWSALVLAISAGFGIAAALAAYRRK